MAKNILDKLAEEVDKIKEDLGVSSPKKAKKTVAAKTEKKDNVSPMEALLEENPIKIPQIGDVLEGTVIDITSNSVLFDLGALGTGIVLGKRN